VELIQQIGSYAGFAAVLGLAVLSALYFSQARDVKRLRDWAGRAPERDAEARSRVAAAGGMAQTPAAQAQAQGQAKPQPAAVAAAGNSGAAAAAASKAPAVAASTAAGAGAGRAGSSVFGRRGPAAQPQPGQRPGSQTAILQPGAAEPRKRWYRRIAPRYVVLIVAGVLVVGGGIAVGVTQYLAKDSGGTAPASGTQAGTTDEGASPEAPRAAPIRPAEVTVGALNSTQTAGLATNVKDQAVALGFKEGPAGNYEGPLRAESVVMYAPGQRAKATLVRRRLKISNIEPMDDIARTAAPNADVVIVIGSDYTP
jgi:hypothetical protein